MKGICSSNGAKIDVYNTVSSTGLNDLADDWDTDNYHYHVRVIPPGRYVLSKPITLHAGNRLLPHPTMPLSVGKELRTIELVAGEGFQPDEQYFYLLKLSEVSLAGGVEIHGSQLPGGVMSSLVKGTKTAPRNTLVLASGTTDTFLAGSVLTGHKSLDALYWNTSTSSDEFYIENHNGVRLQRNYLRQGGASAAVILSIDADSPYSIRNNSIFVEPGSAAATAASGIYLAGGRLNADISNNDFILPPRSAPGSEGVQRRVIEIGDATGFTIDYNAIYTPESRARDPDDIAIYDARKKTEGQRVMSLEGNLFSPHMTPGQADHEALGETMKLMLSGSGSTSMVDSYYLDAPLAFMKNRRLLGSIPLASTALLRGVNGTCIPPDEVSGSDLAQNNLTLLSNFVYDYSQSCPVCSYSYSQVGAIQIFWAVVLPIADVVAAVGCGIFCRRVGMGKCPCKCRR
ncbi:MAG: hypothetical protein ACR2PT_19520 [Endozoicomonas sp.]